MNPNFRTRIQCATWCGLAMIAVLATARSQASPPAKVSIKAAPKVAKDPSLIAVTTNPAFKSGELIYGSYARVRVAKELEWMPFLKQIRTGTAVGAKAISSFQVQGNAHSFDPQFSPNGQQVMFKFGSVGDRYDQYQLYFWNRATNRVQAGPDGLIYPLTYWSPNSRYVAYINGGDGDGNTGPNGFLRLFIYDVKTLRSRFIAQNPMVTMLTWTAQNTLLYTVQKRVNMGQGREPNRAAGADIYAASASSGKPRLFIPDAFDPRISPDGKKVAFWSWPAATPDQTQQQSQLGLYLYDRQTKARTRIRWPFSHLQAVGLRWMSDNRHLVTLQRIQNSPTARTQVAVLDTANATSKNLTILQATDYKEIARSETLPQFRPLDISRDGRFLYVQVSEFVGSDPPFSIEAVSLQAVNLSTGKVSTGAKIKTSLGVDWRAIKAK